MRTCRNANIVVAQHGAALANIFWMRPKTKIIEICPQTLDDDHKMLFRKLAELMDVDYEVVFQESDHSSIKIHRYMPSAAPAGIEAIIKVNTYQRRVG